MRMQFEMFDRLLSARGLPTVPATQPADTPMPHQPADTRQDGNEIAQQCQAMRDMLTTFQQQHVQSANTQSQQIQELLRRQQEMDGQLREVRQRHV